MLRSFLIGLVATLVFTAIALASAGRLDVCQAWVYAGISLALNVGQRIILGKSPELAKERTKPGAARPLRENAFFSAVVPIQTNREQTRFRLVPGLW